MDSTHQLLAHIKQHYDRHNKLADHFMRELNKADMENFGDTARAKQLERDFQFNNTIAYLLADILEKADEIGINHPYMPMYGLNKFS